MAVGVNDQLLTAVKEFHVSCGEAEVNIEVERFLDKPKIDPALDLFKGLLRIHQKDDGYGHSFEYLAKAEPSFGGEWQRDHIVHSCLVYCIGIYLYMSFPTLALALHEEMTRSVATANGKPLFSGGVKWGEFAFQWRLAALCHDLAYPFEKGAGSPEGLQMHLGSLNDILRDLGGGLPLTLESRTWFDRLNQLHFAESTALRLIEETAGQDAINLRWYWWNSRRRLNEPDHGIASALLIYRIADLLYGSHNQDGRAYTPDKPQDAWDPYGSSPPLLTHSLPSPTIICGQRTKTGRH